MDPQDDPEARIRELEQPLSDVARTSELGTAAPSSGEYPYPLPPPPTSPPPGYPPPGYPPPPPGYPPPPPPGAWPYDAGNPATAQLPYDSGTTEWPDDTSAQQWPYGTGQRPSSGSGNRVVWVIGGLAAVFGLAIAGGVAAFLLSSPSGPPGTPVNRPTANGGGGTLSTAPSRTVTIPSPSIEETESPPVAVPPGGELSVSGIGENKTIACDGSVITVSGVSNTVVITGHCASVNVSGIENVITLDTADAIGVSGFDNRITYHSGTPDISNAGGDNTVEQG